MKKNDIFTFTAPNGVEVIAIILQVLDKSKWTYNCKEKCYNFNYFYLCYAQNRLCIVQIHEIQKNYTKERYLIKATLKEVVVDYAILPEYDKMLEEAYLNNHKEETL